MIQDVFDVDNVHLPSETLVRGIDTDSLSAAVEARMQINAVLASEIRHVLGGGF